MLQVNFQIDEKVLATLEKASRGTDIAVVLIVMEKEAMRQLGDAISATGDLASDLERTRAALTAAQLQTAYAVVYGGVKDPVTVLAYTSDSAKAKERMLYSSGLAHLREVVNRHNTTRRTPVHTVQAATTGEIQPSLFQRKEDAVGREALMTESERFKAEVAKMPLAPQPTALPGVQMAISDKAAKLVDAFVSETTGGLTLTFKIDDNQIVVDRQETTKGDLDESNAQLALAKSLLPDDEPRYVLMRYCASKGAQPAAVMVYVCPSACPPKMKMSYASSKASFIAQLSAHKVDVRHRVETGSAAELPDAVADAFVEVNYEETDAKPKSRKPTGACGPRMLI